MCKFLKIRNTVINTAYIQRINYIPEDQILFIYMDSASSASEMVKKYRVSNVCETDWLVFLSVLNSDKEVASWEIE
jgi:hypothetical protein